MTAGILSPNNASESTDFKIKVANLAPVSKEKAIYFMVICSDFDIQKFNIEESVYLSQHYSARHEQEDDVAKRKYVEYLESEVRSLHASKAEVSQALDDESKMSESLRAELAVAQKSLSNRLIRKVRGVKVQ